MSGLSVTEYTDPLCPWAWGSEPAIRRLRALAGPAVRWRTVFGILFDDGDDPAPDPRAETAWYHKHLREIAATTSAPYPGVLERVARTSRPAALAATAAHEQGPDVALRVLRRLREVYFLTGTPPDTLARVYAALAGVTGLDLDRLRLDAAAPATAEAVARGHAETRAPIAQAFAYTDSPPKPIDGGHRYVLPTLRFDGPSGVALAPGRRSVEEYVAAIHRVAPDWPLSPGVLAAGEVFARYATVTVPELWRLTAAADEPPDAVYVPSPGGPLWMSKVESKAHPAVPSYKTYPDGN